MLVQVFHTILHKNPNELFGQPQPYHSTCLYNLTKFISSFLKQFFMAFMIPTFSALIQALLTLISNLKILSAPGATLRSRPIINSSLGHLLSPWLQRLSIYTNKKKLRLQPRISCEPVHVIPIVPISPLGCSAGTWASDSNLNSGYSPPA